MEKHTVHKSEKEAFSVVSRAKSFKHAVHGIFLFIKTTHNAWIHLSVVAIVIYLGFYFHIPTTEWLFLIMAIGFVLVAECFNTAIEFDIDLTSPDYHPYAKYTKDVAAGAVLIASISAAIVGLIIFVPKFLHCF
jgi:diacylglycerol kinase